MRSNQVLRQLSGALKPHTLTQPSPFIRSFGPNAAAGPSRPASLESDFRLYPDFFGMDECRQLLGMALWKLDRSDSTRRRKRKGSSEDVEQGKGGLQALFHGEYGFEEGHYDSVIHHFRETLMSDLPPPDKAWPDLVILMKRIYDLLPAQSTDTPLQIPPFGTSTHLLHLAPHGEILPHVDNLEASGSVIIGTSLGAERTLRLKDKEGDEGWDVRLPSGSLYVQRDSVRYRYEHSILPYDIPGSVWEGTSLDAGHRVSLMVRDAPSRSPSL